MLSEIRGDVLTAGDGSSSENVRVGPDRDAPVICVKGVSKVYRMWNRPVSRLRAVALERAASAFRRQTRIATHLRQRAQSEFRDFQALSGIDFEVGGGESIAVIGRNGSGKSTLLQIIAGTLKPTTGAAEVRGRVAALLELGSSFHPQFTGRENVYLYCAILGIQRSQVDELMDDIAAFADIGDFMDQPVLTYSSGMKLRLAFSVQTAISPEILIVDEALAVGDMFFQAKCMRRIRGLVENGTTLLFVSHSMSVVRELCNRAVLLDHGRMVLDDEVARVTQRYLALQVGAQEEVAKTEGRDSASQAPPAAGTSRQNDGNADPQSLGDPWIGGEIFETKAGPERIQDGRAFFCNVQMLNTDAQIMDTFEFDESVILRMVVEVVEPVENLWIGYHIRSKTGVDAVHCDSSLCGESGRKFEAGESYVLDWRFPARLQHGNYYIMCVLGIPDPPEVTQPRWEYVDVVNHACDFSIAPRRRGMIGGIVALVNELTISKL